MICGDKEWKHCRVEKLTCIGCYYNTGYEEDIKLLEEMKANCIKGMMKGAIYTDEKAERKALALENSINRLREWERLTETQREIIEKEIKRNNDLEKEIEEQKIIINSLNCTVEQLRENQCTHNKE